MIEDEQGPIKIQFTGGIASGAGSLRHASVEIDARHQR
jgi:hypothetical protein